MQRSVRDELFRLKDEKYKEFSLKLLPGVNEGSMIGVRIPLLRKMALEIIKKPFWSEYLKYKENLYFEEKMLQGIIIGKVKIDLIERLELIDNFLPKIDNWSVCDSFVSGLKFAKEERNQKIMWDYITPLFSHNKEFYVRFASVVSLNYFLNDSYMDRVLEAYKNIKHEGYYAKMSVSWGISVAYVKNKEKTMDLLKNDTKLDNDTFNKAIQKIIESKQVDLEDKKLLKKMKKG